MHEQVLENLAAPAGARLGEHAMVGNVVVDPETEEPQVIDSVRDLAHEFAFGGDVVEEQQEHQLHDQFGVFGLVAALTVGMRHRRPCEREIDDPNDLPQGVVFRDPPRQINLVGKKRFLPVSNSHHRYVTRLRVQFQLSYKDYTMAVKGGWATRPEDVTPIHQSNPNPYKDPSHSGPVAAAAKSRKLARR